MRKKKYKSSPITKAKPKKTKKVQRPKAVDHKNFLNREITWLKFNERVLDLCEDDRTPLFERLKFCNIFISNLDEFYMKRIGGLKNLIVSSYPFLSIDGRSPQDQITQSRSIVTAQMSQFATNFHKNILPALATEGIHLVEWKDLEESEKSFLNDYFHTNIFPVVTPLAVDYGHPFPFISNLSKSIGICLKKPNIGEKLFARVKVPKEVQQWIPLPTKNKTSRWVALEDIIINNLGSLFPGMTIVSKMVFRVTRNVDIEDDDESAEDLLELVEDSLHEKRFSPVIRLEHENKVDKWILKYLMNELALVPEDVYEMPSFACHSNFSSLLEIDRPKLKYDPWTPRVPREILDDGPNFFHLLKRKDMLVQHPYESFNATVERFIQSASQDPQVLAIKMTLYRTNINGEIINSLIYAAEHGKQVACIIELKARFDEEKNIYLAQKLENAGVHVIMGMVGLKTHSKMCLVVRRDHSGINTYVHIGTGNYNSATAQIYEDYSYFTSKKNICQEVMEVFNYLTGISLKTDYKKLLVAPLTMRKRFLELINEETRLSENGKDCLIIAKMNSLEDVEIIEALYKASQAGVKIELIVRGFCCLRPKLEGLSENISVISVVGRFLEHSRIYYFSKGQESKEKGEFYLGSGDWMYRNLSNRVEIIVPIEEAPLKNKIWKRLEVILNDKVSAWDMDENGKYHKRKNKDKGDNILTSHQILMKQSIADNSQKL